MEVIIFKDDYKKLLDTGEILKYKDVRNYEGTFTGKIIKQDPAQEAIGSC